MASELFSRIWQTVLVGSILSCTSCSHRLATTSIRWTNEDLFKFTFILQDPDTVVQFRFSESGFVGCSLGSKTGWICNPGFNWTITASGEILIYDEKNIQYRLILLDVKNNLYTVRLNNKTTEFIRVPLREAPPPFKIIGPQQDVTDELKKLHESITQSPNKSL